MIYIGSSEIPKEGERRGGANNAQPTWNWPVGQPVRVSCFTNADEAELFLNGKSLGRKALAQAKGRILFWDVDYQPGELGVKGYKGGKEVSMAGLKTAGAPYAIKATADCRALNAKKIDLAHLVLTVVDQQGNLVYQADQEITVTVEGPAQLLGLEGGSLTSPEAHQATKRKVVKGKMPAYIQSQAKPGLITITLQSPGLQSARLEIQSE